MEIQNSLTFLTYALDNPQNSNPFSEKIGDIMKHYYIESIIQKIGVEIKQLIDEHIITQDKKIILYGFVCADGV